MPGIIKIQHQQNNPDIQNAPAADPQVANAWWSNLCNLSLNTPKGPARNLTDATGLSHLFVVKDAADNGFSLEAVNANPDPQKLYVLAQQGRLLLTPTGSTGGAYQVQVNPEKPEKSMLQGVTEQTMAQTFTDPRQGIGYQLMRFLNTITGGLLFSQQLNAMDQEVAAADAMTEVVKNAFLSQQDADAEWNDPAHLNSLRQAGYITKPSRPENAKDAKLQSLQRTEDLLNFAENVYDLFGAGEYPKSLLQTSVSTHHNNNFYKMSGGTDDFSPEDLALMAFLTMSNPNLDYYQTPHLADYGTLSGRLSGPDLIQDRMDQFYAGMLGDRDGALDAIYVTAVQAAKKIDALCQKRNPDAQDFADAIVHGLNRLQNTLQTSETADDRFLQAASLAGHVNKFLLNNPALLYAVQDKGFYIDTDLFDQADNFHQMQVKAMRAEAQIRDHALGFPHDKVPEEILKSSLPVIAESRFQTMNIKENGLQSVLPLYSNPFTSDNICKAISKSSAYEAMNGCTYRQLEGMIRNNADLFNLCSQALQGPENKPNVPSNEQELSISAQHQSNPMVP